MDSLVLIDGKNLNLNNYIYTHDIENEISNRIIVLSFNDELSAIDHEIVKGMINIFDQENQIVRAFRMATNHFKKSEFSPIQ